MTAGRLEESKAMIRKLMITLALGFALPLTATAASTEPAVASVDGEVQNLKASVLDLNRELFAQGAGNIVCGLIGGLPLLGSTSRGV